MTEERSPPRRPLELEIQPQPDDSTCGPTCLHALYRYHGDDVPLEEVIAEVRHLEEGGTLAVLLACHALRRGYRATIYTCNLQLFDPTWFQEPRPDLANLLRRQKEAKADDEKLGFASDGYLEFLDLGGELHFQELDAALIRRYLRRDIPILSGCSATYLYGCAREVGVPGEHRTEYDSVRGQPTGHFVVLCGYDPEERRVRVADPLHGNPGFEAQVYEVDLSRFLAALLLGVLTYDANILVIEPIEPIESSRP